jgi:hypothetical protein
MLREVDEFHRRWADKQSHNDHERSEQSVALVLARNTLLAAPPPHVAVTAGARPVLVVALSAAVFTLAAPKHTAGVPEVALSPDHFIAQITLLKSVRVIVGSAPFFRVGELVERSQLALFVVPQ